MIKQTLILLMPLMLAACAKVGAGGVPSRGLASETGNEQGNGSDYSHIGDGSAWFVGSLNKIKYCIETAEHFGVTDSITNDAVETALDRWSKYISVKKVYGRSPPQHQLAIQREKLARCDGSEDLAFYFGVENNITKFYIKQIDGRVATAVRTSYNPIKAWGKGFVWVTANGTIPTDHDGLGWYPNWTHAHNLTGILTHELGHVYGVEHVNGTIMRKDIANELSWSRGIRAQNLDAIDDTKELVMCESFDINFSGALGMFQVTSGVTTKAQDTVTETFAVLTGHDPVGGPLSVKAVLRGNLQSGLVLEVVDNERSHRFEVNLDYANRMSYMDSVDVFKFVIKRESEGTGNTRTEWVLNERHPHEGYAANGTILTGSGRILPITLQRNMNFPFANPTRDSYPFVVTYSLDGKIKPLFLVTPAGLN